jgi:RNA polymerase sigma-70 factor (ECF subfamily)
MSSPPVSDAALIARVVVSDDRYAFGELVRRHQSAVRATLRKLTGGNTALADDLAQDTFLLAYRNLKSFRQEARFSTWLYRIAYNAFLADTRKMKEWPLPEDADSLAPADTAEGHGVARARHCRSIWNAPWPSSPDAERAAIVRLPHDLTHEEAAEVLGCPVGTIKTHILRAKAKLRTRLGAWTPGN